MGWYSTTYKKRVAITVPNVAGDATIDVNVTIPPEWDDFWQKLSDLGDTTGLSLRVCNSDGVTLLNYSVDNGSGGAFSTSARTGRIQIDGIAVAATANTVCCFWLYYYTEATQSSGATATTIASAKTGYIDLGRPNQKGHVVRQAGVGRTTPFHSYQKGSNDSDDVWLDWSAWLEKPASQLRGKSRYEEPKNVVITAVDEGGGAITTVYTVTATRWNEQPDGKLYLRVQVTGGASGTNYTIMPKVTTVVPNETSSDHRIFQERFGMHVYDVQEAA